MLHRLCKPPSIPLNFSLAAVVFRLLISCVSALSEKYAKNKSYKARPTLNTRYMTIYVYMYTKKYIFHDRTYHSIYIYKLVSHNTSIPISSIHITICKETSQNIYRAHWNEKQKKKYVYFIYNLNVYLQSTCILCV